MTIDSESGIGSALSSPGVATDDPAPAPLKAKREWVRWAGKGIPIRCPNCATIFLPPRSESRYCSRTCAARVHGLGRKRTLESRRRQSEKLRNKWVAGGYANRKMGPSSGRKVPMETKICPGCGEIFLPYRTEIKYCRRECYFASRVRPRGMCLVCGATTTRSRGLPRRYCSIGCRNRSAEGISYTVAFHTGRKRPSITGERIRAALIGRVPPKRDTTPERMVRHILDGAGISYRHDVGIGGVCRPDFVVDGVRAAIFVDGDYWHANPAKFPFPINETQRANLQRDVRHSNALAALGWRVVRVWEADLKNDPNACRKRILEVLRG